MRILNVNHFHPHYFYNLRWATLHESHASIGH